MLLPRTLGYLTLSGELDASARDGLLEALEALVPADAAVIDFAGVTYCDSTAISCLVALRKRMREAGTEGDVRIVHANGSIRRILEICNLDSVFSLHESLRGAGLTAQDGSSVVTHVGNFDAGTPGGELPD